MAKAMRSPLRLSLLLASLISLMPPARAADIPGAPTPEITSEAEHKDWADLVLGTHSLVKERDALRVTVRGTFKGERVAFEALVGSTWKSERMGGNVPMFIGRIAFRSVGAESDAFVRALAQIYRLNASALAMKPEVVFEAISLEGDPRRLEAQKVAIKLFYEPENQKRYAEAYGNFDLPSRKFYFKEKDPEYRRNLLGAFKK
jgi:hypothetical protein